MRLKKMPSVEERLEKVEKDLRHYAAKISKAVEERRK
jgi:hypothetical protein